MVILHYRNKVTRVRKCDRCGGKGSHGYDNWVKFGDGMANFGMTYICGCNGGYRVDYPWTRGKSMVPLIGVTAKRTGFMGLFS